jgi:hypothetical protein
MESPFSMVLALGVSQYDGDMEGEAGVAEHRQWSGFIIIHSPVTNAGAARCNSVQRKRH